MKQTQTVKMNTDNYETLNQKYHSKEIVASAEGLLLSLPSQQSTLLKKTSNVNKEQKKDMIILLQTDKQDSWKQVKILSRAGKVGKSKSGKDKNHWNVLDVQGYTKVIDFENDIEEWRKLSQVVLMKQHNF